MDDDQQNYGDDYGGNGDSTTAYADDSGGNGDGATGYADVAVNQIYVQPETLQATDQVILGVEARNGGSVESGPFKVRYTIDNGDSQDFDFPSIQPGATYYEDWNHAPMPAGNYTFSAMLDIENQVQEYNRDDNSAYIGFMVQDTPGTEEDNGGQDLGQDNTDDQPMSGNDADASSAELAYEGDMEANADAEAINDEAMA